ncbi:DJ-1/PfpI family protein [Maribacter sp.]|nr:DJ-1/PfpI family protein [Maribacter sp.]
MTLSKITLLTVFLFLEMGFSSEVSAQDATKGAYVCTPCNKACDALNFDKGGVCNHCNMPLLLQRDLVKKRKIAFYLQDGVEILDFAGPMEVFAYAGFEVFTVSKNKQPILTQGILKIIPDYGIADAPSADILAFFGGNASEAHNDPEVIKWVTSQQNIEYYFSVCTGAFILAESGLLKGKSATTFHNALDGLQHNYPEIKVLENVRFVDNGSIITTAGISAGIDGALHLVAKLNGFNAARNVAYYMEYDKWMPGEGRLLSDDNPYTGFMDIDKLEAYVGSYEYLDDMQIEITINENEKSLLAVVNKRKYPLFYHKTDSLSNVSGDTIIFERRANKTVSGFKSIKYGDTLFLKLN